MTDLPNSYGMATPKLVLNTTLSAGCTGTAYVDTQILDACEPRAIATKWRFTLLLGDTSKQHLWFSDDRPAIFVTADDVCLAKRQPHCL